MLGRAKGIKMTDVIKKYIESVRPADEAAMKAASERQAMLAKPPGSLGTLEEISVIIAGITGSVINRIEKKHLLVFAADNGVCEEGVASAPQSVTGKQAVNITRGKAGAGVLARHFGARVTVVDVGVKEDTSGTAVVQKKLMRGTANIAKGPAMTKDVAEEAFAIGYETAANAEGDIIGIGEMGIGNTTTSTAVLSVLLGEDPDALTGLGAGITREALENKIKVIRRAIDVNAPDEEDVIDVIAKVGGLDIAAMCGAFIGCAASRRPVVVDGYISAVAALAAVRLCPFCAEYMIPSHRSEEPGYVMAMEALGKKPFLDLHMRLGEGSGCVPAFEIISAACAVMSEMATFAEADIDDGYLDEIREKDVFGHGGDGCSYI